MTLTPGMAFAVSGVSFSGVAAPEGVKQSPPPCRHSGIFIPLARDSGIAVLRWRNENVRNLLRQGERILMGRTVSPPIGLPARYRGGIPDIFIPRDCIRRGHSTSRPRGMKIPE